jgi:hypothetical protein
MGYPEGVETKWVSDRAAGLDTSPVAVTGID